MREEIITIICLTLVKLKTHLYKISYIQEGISDFMTQAPSFDIVMDAYLIIT